MKIIFSSPPHSITRKSVVAQLMDPIFQARPRAHNGSYLGVHTPGDTKVRHDFYVSRVGDVPTRLHSQMVATETYYE